MIKCPINCTHHQTTKLPPPPSKICIVYSPDWIIWSRYNECDRGYLYLISTRIIDQR